MGNTSARRRRRFTGTIAGSLCALSALLAPQLALADDVKQAEVAFSFDDSLVSPTYDSGLVPMGSPLQVQLFAQFRDRFDIDAAGLAAVDWSSGELSFAADEGAGRLSYSLGGEVSATINLTLTQLPLGPFALDIPAITGFTPFLLPGADDRPVETATTLAFNIADESFTIGSTPGNFTLDVEVDIVGLSFQGERIVIARDYDPQTGELLDLVGEIAGEGDALQLDIEPPEAPGQVALWAQYEGTISSEVELRLLPSFSAGVFGPITLDLAVPIEVVDGELIAFDPVLIEIEGPDPEPEPDPDPDPDPDPIPDLPMDDDEGETGDAGFGGASDDGCGCAASPTGSRGAAGLAALALIALPALRRRRGR